MNSHQTKISKYSTAASNWKALTLKLDRNSSTWNEKKPNVFTRCNSLQRKLQFNTASSTTTLLKTSMKFWFCCIYSEWQWIWNTRKKTYHPFPWFVSVIRRKLTHTKKSAVITNPIMGKWTSDKSLQTVKSAQILLHA